MAPLAGRLISIDLLLLWQDASGDEKLAGGGGEGEGGAGWGRGGVIMAS